MKSKNICQILLFMLLLSQPIIGQVQDSISISNEKENVSSEGNSLKDHYLFVYDGLYDMIGSGKDFLSISHLFGRGLDELTCHPNENTGIYTCFEKKNFLERILIDGVNFIFTNWLSTAQHECMGHGFRAREFNARINQYYIEPGIFGGEARVDFNREDLPYYGLLLEDAGVWM